MKIFPVYVYMHISSCDKCSASALHGDFALVSGIAKQVHGKNIYAWWTEGGLQYNCIPRVFIIHI